MSSPNDSSSSPCTEFAGLLLPYVDVELAEPESHAVLEHISACQGCTEVVAEQQRVRALLTQLSPPSMPEHLLQRVTQALDEVDQEQAQKVQEATPWLWAARLKAMFRGGLVMVPAAAAAALLWVSLRPQAPTSEAPLATATTPETQLNASALPASVPPPILNAAALPRDIEFVSAKPDVVRYRHASRNFQLIDRRQRGALPSSYTAHVHREGSRTYLLRRDANGTAHLNFELGPHTHHVVLVPEKAFARPGAISAQDPDFFEMLRYARALQRAVMH